MTRHLDHSAIEAVYHASTLNGVGLHPKISSLRLRPAASEPRPAIVINVTFWVVLVPDNNVTA